LIARKTGRENRGLRREHTYGPGKFFRKIIFVPKNFAAQIFLSQKIPGNFFSKAKIFSFKNLSLRNFLLKKF